MNCPRCEYEFDPANGLSCPRCGASVSCSDVSCAECGACSRPFDRLWHTIAERLPGGGRADDGDGHDESAEES